MKRRDEPLTFADLLNRCHITERGCWEWTGSRDDSGYGKVYHRTGSIKAHRLAAREVSLPGIGPYVLHQCDNPACFNPAHLFRGTQQDNMRDAQAKGRLNGGRGIPRPHPHLRKLSLKDAAFIRGSWKPRDPQLGLRALSRTFGVSFATIHQIISGRTYKEITPS